MVVKTVKMKERRRNAEGGREERKGRSLWVHKTVMKLRRHTLAEKTVENTTTSLTYRATARLSVWLFLRLSLKPRWNIRSIPTANKQWVR